MNALPPASDAFSAFVETAAREFCGDVNVQMSSKTELRFGSHGSLSVEIGGPKRGVWFNYETGEHGGVLDLLRIYGGLAEKSDALAWLQKQGAPFDPPKASKGRIVATYDYVSNDGTLLFQVVRFEPKAFRQRRPNGAGGWLWNLTGVERVLYRLPELTAAFPGDLIFVAEGEKDVDALCALGLIATCNAGGAAPQGESSKWPDSFAVHFTARDVVILPDNDKPGAAHATAIAMSLTGLNASVASVKILHLPDLPPKGDASDWLAMGGTAAQLKTLAAASAPFDRTTVKTENVPAANGRELYRISEKTDTTVRSPATCELILAVGKPLISARQFLLREHTVANARTLVHQNDAFYAWQGSHYTERPAEEMTAGLYRFLDGAKRVNDENQIVPFDPTKAKVANVLDALAAEAQLPGSIRPPSWLIADANAPKADEIISCRNVLLHLPTGRTDSHTPSFYTLCALDFDYVANAPEPVQWLNFLDNVWPDDQQAIDTLQEMFGLLLTADTRYQKAFLIVGPKRSGKGTIARVLTQLLGSANVCGPTLSGLGTNFGLAPLIGKRLAIVSDARLSGKADQQVIVERLLSITGEDGLTIDRKFRDGWTGKLDARFVILTNEMPRLTDSSGALASRFVILKMTQSFIGREDLGLGARLIAELPGILLWAIAGWKRLTTRGYFIPPASSAAAQQEMEDLGSPIGAFLRDRCMVGQGLCVRIDDLYRAWCEWCQEQGRDHHGSVATFGRDLAAAVPGLTPVQRREPDGRRTRFYEGVAFAPT